MVIQDDTNKLQKALWDFYQATGVNIGIVGTNLKSIASLSEASCQYCEYIQSTAAGYSLCKHSDQRLLESCKNSRKAQMHICKAGLMDIAVPIIYNDLIIAYVIMGQIRIHESFDNIQAYINELGLDADKLRQLYLEKPTIDESRLQSIENIAVMFAKYILFEKILSPSINENLEKADRYILDNLHRELTVRDISRQTNISKTVLYNIFHTFYNCTLKEYINTRRIEQSLELLSDTSASIEEISQKLGFTSAAYFCRVFKRIKGTSPLKYRKSATSNHE